MVLNTLRIRPAIILFGDSLTQYGFGEGGQVGWASLLGASYQRRADIFNRGFSGYNTRHAKSLLPGLFDGPSLGEDSVLFYTVWFGANDSALPGQSQHVPLEEYGANLGKIITGIRQLNGSAVQGDESCPSGRFPNPPIIVLTPPPLDKSRYTDSPPDRTNENARLYGLEAMRVAKEHECTVLDVWELLRGNETAKEYGKYLSDGLHLSAEGNSAVFEGLSGLIQREYPHLSPMTDGNGRYGKQGVPMEGKLWRELV